MVWFFAVQRVIGYCVKICFDKGFFALTEWREDFRRRKIPCGIKEQKSVKNKRGRVVNRIKSALGLRRLPGFTR